MKTFPSKKFPAVLALAAATTMVLSACSGSSDDSAATTVVTTETATATTTDNADDRQDDKDRDDKDRDDKDRDAAAASTSRSNDDVDSVIKAMDESFPAISTSDFLDGSDPRCTADDDDDKDGIVDASCTITRISAIESKAKTPIHPTYTFEVATDADDIDNDYERTGRCEDDRRPREIHGITEGLRAFALTPCDGDRGDSRIVIYDLNRPKKDDDNSYAEYTISGIGNEGAIDPIINALGLRR